MIGKCYFWLLEIRFSDQIWSFAVCWWVTNQALSWHEWPDFLRHEWRPSPCYTPSGHGYQGRMFPHPQRWPWPWWTMVVSYILPMADAIFSGMPYDDNILHIFTLWMRSRAFRNPQRKSLSKAILEVYKYFVCYIIGPLCIIRLLAIKIVGLLYYSLSWFSLSIVALNSKTFSINLKRLRFIWNLLDCI